MTRRYTSRMGRGSSQTGRGVLPLVAVLNHSYRTPRHIARLHELFNLEQTWEANHPIEGDGRYLLTRDPQGTPGTMYASLQEALEAAVSATDKHHACIGLYDLETMVKVKLKYTSEAMLKALPQVTNDFKSNLEHLIGVRQAQGLKAAVITPRVDLARYVLELSLDGHGRMFNPVHVDYEFAVEAIGRAWQDASACHGLFDLGASDWPRHLPVRVALSAPDGTSAAVTV